MTPIPFYDQLRILRLICTDYLDVDERVVAIYVPRQFLDEMNKHAASLGLLSRSTEPTMMRSDAMIGGVPVWCSGAAERDGVPRLKIESGRIEKALACAPVEQ